VSSANSTLNVASKLSIIGLGEERKISWSTTSGAKFALSANMRLILGKNITLKGYATSANNTVVSIAGGASLTMLDGSKITDNKSNTNVSAAVTVTAANSAFIMKGGEISGNHNEGPQGGTQGNTNQTTAGVYVTTQGAILLSGGKIINNTSTFTPGTASDIFLADGGLITLSGNVEVGSIQLNCQPVPPGTANTYTYITVGDDYTGVVNKIHLRGGSNATALQTKTWFSNNQQQILRPGPGARIDMFNSALGQFRTGIMNTTVGDINDVLPISDAHQLNASGVLVAK
jgi:hypothetical protein